MILLLDNYDSFVFNLERYLRELGCETETVRSDRVTVSEVRCRAPTAIVISPGPCTPLEAGVSVEVVQRLGSSVPILGVCLGHQAIVMAYDGRLMRSPEPMHGRNSAIIHHERGLFRDLPNPLRVGRYHSLIADESAWPEELSITARSETGLVMACEHRRHPVWGVQFHPESILTQEGHRILENFLGLAGITVQRMPLTPEYLPPVVPSDDFYQQPIGDGSFPPW